MKYLRLFGSVSDMETAIASSEIGIMGLAYDNGTPVMKIKPTPPPTPVIEYTVTTHVSPRRSGTISGVESSYASGALVELIANPSTYSSGYYTFVRWQDENEQPFGDDPTNPVLSFNITSDVEVFAIFELHETQYNLSCVIVPSSAESECSVFGTGMVSQGSNPKLRATYSLNFALNHWEIDGVDMGNGDELTIPNIQSDVTVYVYFDYVPPQDNNE